MIKREKKLHEILQREVAAIQHKLQDKLSKLTTKGESLGKL